MGLCSFRRTKLLTSTTLLCTLFLHGNTSWGQIVLTSDASSIITITGLPGPTCNHSVAIFKYTATPQNQATLAGQVEQTLAGIPTENRIVLEAGRSYRYHLQVKSSPGTNVHPPLLGSTHGAGTDILPVYWGTDAVLPPPAKAGSIQAKSHHPAATGYVKFEGLLKLSQGTDKGFLCIPYREKTRSQAVHTTNIIIPFTVRKAEKSAAIVPRPEIVTDEKAASDLPAAIKERIARMPAKPIMGVATNVQLVRQSVQPDAGMALIGTPSLLTFTRDCRLDEEEPESIRPDLRLKVFPNPSSGATQLQYYLPESGEVMVMIYDLQGKAVQALLPKTQQDAGLHQLQWRSGGLPSGMYIVRVQTATGFTAEKIMVTKDTHR